MLSQVKVWFLFDVFLGRKPRKRTLSAEKPERARAVVAAVGPGIISRLMLLASMASLIRLKPGSEIVGRPASETRIASWSFSWLRMDEE